MTQDASIEASGRRALECEGKALMRLATALPADFAAAVRAMEGARGRVIASGLGKSGHVARKIAGTLASTGTPAHFVHAAEAGHGDLGMITAADVCLVLSNSGETADLQAIVAHARRFAIPLIAMGGRADSTLMRAADLKLLLPEAEEACGLGVVPTTSTTMMLALGDALAVALMERRAFRHADFRATHPGGTLGARLLRVDQLMHAGEAVPLVGPDTPMSDVLIEMTSKGFGIAGVVEDGRLTGAISDGDLRRNMDDLMRRRARDVATPDPKTVSTETLAVEALALMNHRKIGAVFVADPDGAPVGILHLHDCLRAGLA